MRSEQGKAVGLHAHLGEIARPWVEARHDTVAMRGVLDGSLDPAVMRRWLEQDSIYLRAYGRAMARLASLAPDRHVTTLVDGAYYTLHTEVERLAELGELFGADLASARAGDACRLYTEHLDTHSRHFADGVVAVLPCMMGFAALGLVPDPPDEPRYRRWVEIYASTDFQGYTARFATIVDDLDIDVARAEAIFERGMELEIVLWEDAATAGP